MLLKDYLVEYCINKSMFMRKAGISAPSLARAVAGETISMRTACKIVQASDGKVKVEDLIPIEYS